MSRSIHSHSNKARRFAPRRGLAPSALGGAALAALARRVFFVATPYANQSEQWGRDPPNFQIELIEQSLGDVAEPARDVEGVSGLDQRCESGTQKLQRPPPSDSEAPPRAKRARAPLVPEGREP